MSWVYMAKPHNNSEYLTLNLFRMQTKFDYYRYLYASLYAYYCREGGGQSVIGENGIWSIWLLGQAMNFQL